MIIPKASIVVLPRTGQAIKIYMALILDNDSFVQATVTATQLLYGNAMFTQADIFISYDNNPIAIQVTGVYNSVEYVDILYTKAVMSDVTPDNFKRLIQKIPEGVFLQGIYDATIIDGTPQGDGNVVGWDFKARSQMIDDYYQQYFFAKEQIYSNQYSSELEYEYNGTVGLLSNSIYLDKLFQLLATSATVRLNSYDLELFVSRYIYYRIGIVCAAYIDDHIDPPGLYWTLNVSELNVSTILAPASYQPAIKDLSWIIFNTSTFTVEFRDEVTALIKRISRADIGNTVHFNYYDIINDIQFSLVGATYKNDPRLIYDKALQFIGDNNYPLNIIGYIRTDEPIIIEILSAYDGNTIKDIGINSADINDLLLVSTPY